ncbi:hypothetical protein [Nocardia sp. NPDC004604]|uniref:hypothetical protein n=1 Tax=Nocardia sp. NPDC004604 TaxID=3157013 RepID=UPI0033B402FC
MILPPLFLWSLFVAQPVSAAQPDGAAAGAAPWGSGAIAPPGGIRPYVSEVVFGECTGSAHSAPHPGGGLAPVPLQLAPLVVNVRPNALRVNGAPGALRVEVALDALGVNVTPDALHVAPAPDALRVDRAPHALHVDLAPDSPRVNVASDVLRVDVAPNVASVDLALDALHVDLAPDIPHVSVTPDALDVNVAPNEIRMDLAPNALRVDGAPTPVFGAGMAPLPTDIVRGQGTGSASSLPQVVDDLLSRLLELLHRAPLQLPR